VPRLRLAFGTLLLGQLAWTIGQVVFAIFAGKLINDYVATHEVTRAWWNRDVGFTALCQTIAGTTNFLMSQYWAGPSTAACRTSRRAVPGCSRWARWPWPSGRLVGRDARSGRRGRGPGRRAGPAVRHHLRPGRQGRARAVHGLATSTQHVGNLLGFVGGGALAQLWTESGNFALTAGSTS